MSEHRRLGAVSPEDQGAMWQGWAVEERPEEATPH